MTWFDASQIEPSTGSAQFPVGRHPVVIRSSSQQAVKDKPTEGMLLLQLEIIDGPHKGVTGPYRLNLWNSSQQAAEIASKQLSAICHVVGTHHLVDKVNMCSELFNKPFVIAVSQQTQNPQYTQIDGVVDMSGNPAKRGQLPSAPPQQQAPQQPAYAPQPQAPQQPAPTWQASQTQQQAAPPQQAAPSWGQPPSQAPNPSAPPTTAPSWGAPPNAAPPAGQPPAQPSWAAPPAGAQPSWGR